jgi:hypothetical protein
MLIRGRKDAFRKERGSDAELCTWCGLLGLPWGLEALGVSNMFPLIGGLIEVSNNEQTTD